MPPYGGLPIGCAKQCDGPTRLRVAVAAITSRSRRSCSHAKTRRPLQDSSLLLRGHFLSAVPNRYASSASWIAPRALAVPVGFAYARAATVVALPTCLEWYPPSAGDAELLGAVANPCLCLHVVSRVLPRSRGGDALSTRWRVSPGRARPCNSTPLGKHCEEHASCSPLLGPANRALFARRDSPGHYLQRDEADGVRSRRSWSRSVVGTGEDNAGLSTALGAGLSTALPTGLGATLGANLAAGLGADLAAALDAGLAAAREARLRAFATPWTPTPNTDAVRERSARRTVTGTCAHLTASHTAARARRHQETAVGAAAERSHYQPPQGHAGRLARPVPQPRPQRPLAGGDQLSAGRALQPMALPVRRAGGGASDGARAHPLGLPCDAGGHVVDGRGARGRLASPACPRGRVAAPTAVGLCRGCGLGAGLRHGAGCDGARPDGPSGALGGRGGDCRCPGHG
eukprot:360178-Chlamydomonas_euryale.AAC.10